MTREQLQRLEPPPGWEWERRPGLRTSGKIKSTSIRHDGSATDAARDTRALFEWAKEHDLGLVSTNPNGMVRVRERNIGIGVYVRPQFIVRANQPDRTRVRTSAFKKSCCGLEAEPWQLVCNQCYVSLACGHCGVAGLTLYSLGDDGRGYTACAECSSPCKEKCGGRIPKNAAFDKCNACDPKVYCQWCDKTVSAAEAKEVMPEVTRRGRRIERASFMCKPCHDKRKCPVCGEFSLNVQMTTRASKKMCQLCADKIDAKDLDKHANFDNDELPISGSLVIPSTKERPFRTISIETEVNGDGGFIARTLYRKGLVPLPAVAGYQQHAQDNDDHIAFMKYDGTVTGGEIILGKLNLDDPEHAEATLAVLQNMHALEKAKKLTIGANCGGHVHIDAHNLDFSDAWRYTTVYNYIENPVYRLGGGGQQHRMLSKDRAIRGAGQEYTKGIIKGPWGTQSAFGRSLMEMDRLCGLNFTNFLEGRHKCTCGAYATENSKNCQCNLGKQTIEWRVWNATCNPRILHGWIALMQAVTAFAESDEKMTKEEEAKYPAFGWDNQPFTAKTHEKPTKERLEWMHSHLPLSLAERDSLVYACKNSELKVLGTDYLESLLQIENQSAIFEKKGVRNPNRRQRKIRLAPPEPGQEVPVASNPFDGSIPQPTIRAAEWVTDSTNYITFAEHMRQQAGRR